MSPWKKLSLPALTLVLISCQSEPVVEEGLTSVSWLPSSATQVSFSETFGWKAYECEMSEQSFLSWTQSDGLVPVEITEPTKILRYTWIDSSLPKKRGRGEHTILRGLHIQDINSGGAGYDLAFDRDQGKVYYHYQAH